MCLAIPGLIMSISSEEGLRMARVSFNGVIKDISVEWVPEARVGDYVIVHAGSALTILNTREAEETLDLFRQISQAQTDN
jgi:hydrogenase expression/formation protein HypC